jgi:hypothetical protein
VEAVAAGSVAAAAVPESVADGSVDAAGAAAGWLVAGEEDGLAGGWVAVLGRAGAGDEAAGVEPKEEGSEPTLLVTTGAGAAVPIAPCPTGGVNEPVALFGAPGAASP